MEHGELATRVSVKEECHPGNIPPLPLRLSLFSGSLYQCQHRHSQSLFSGHCRPSRCPPPPLEIAIFISHLPHSLIGKTLAHFPPMISSHLPLSPFLL
ncbi:hypothetical protein ACLOJK_038389 [Asimina triloba]